VSGVEEAGRFLDALLEGVSDLEDGLHFYGWTLADKRSHSWPVSEGSAPAAQRFSELAEASDAYIGVSLAGEPVGARTRVRSETSAGIFGLWADIDIADPVAHKKWGLPPDMESAVELLDATGLPPTVVIHSGHGLQAWWLFKEAWIFEDDSDRTEAAVLAESWNTTIRVHATERNWTVDSTFDLARVMRIPGTKNRKGEPIVPVTFYREELGPRYDPSDIEEFCVGEERLRELGISGAQGEVAYVVGDLTLDPDAKPPADALMHLRDTDEKFDETWKETRKDLNKVDGSPSQYDMAMVSMLVGYNWEDQDVVDACVARRRMHGHDLKLRADYWKRTLAKAHESSSRNHAEEHLDEQIDELTAAIAEGDDELIREKRRQVLDSLSQQLGYTLTAFVKYVGDPPSFDLRTPVGTIHYTDATMFVNQSQFSAKFWSITGYRPTPLKPQIWHEIVNNFGKIWEEQEIGQDATEEGLMSRYLENYLEVCPPDGSIEQAVASGFPYVDEESGDVFISADGFRQHLWTTHGERMQPRKIGRLLSLLGASSESKNVKIGEKRSTRSLWKLPASMG